MCGIAGIINLNNKSVIPSMLYSMSKAIAHRGPDDEGYALISSHDCKKIQFCGPASNKIARAQFQNIKDSKPHSAFNIGLAHRRFSIIDLSEAGHQPFSSIDNRWALIYNGEIYNYKEIRKELESTGITFNTQTDTEVVLAAYKKWGVDCFNKFNGFWAIAIFDPDKKCVIISRDRIGIKPLYYTYFDGNFIFASEIKALLTATKRTSVNNQAAQDWLRFGIKDHTSDTFFEDIKSFPAASWAYITPQYPLNIQRFWSLPVKRKNFREYPVTKAIADLRSILTDAIKIRLRADVPLAVQLSGGIDSSVIAALAKYELNVALPAYTVKFPDPEADEEPYARIVANSCCSEYSIVNSPSGSIWRDIDKFTWLHEEPYHSPNLYIDQQVLSIMRKDGIKVALNGAAGDENFGGYGHHFTLMQLQRLTNFNIFGYINSALQCKDTPNITTAFLKPFAYAFRESLSGSRQLSLNLNKRLLQDMSTGLMPYWLASGDRNYMGSPTEIREPFLDYKVIEFAFTLPLEYLINEGWQKWLLRKTIEPYLPKEIVWRKRKMGYPFPMDSFLKQNYKIEQILSRTKIDLHKKPFQLVRKNNRWKTLSYVLWYEWFVNNNHQLFESIKGIAQQTSNWPVTPEYFNSFRSIAD